MIRKAVFVTGFPKDLVANARYFRRLTWAYAFFCFASFSGWIFRVAIFTISGCTKTIPRYSIRQLVSKFRHHNKVLFGGGSLLDQGLPLNADRIKVDDTVGHSAFVLIKHTRPMAGSHFLLDRVNQSDTKGVEAGLNVHHCKRYS